MSKSIAFTLALFFCLSMFSSGTAKAQVSQTPKVQLFSLSNVRLLPSEFKNIQDLDHKYLLSLEPDRLLSWFRREAGLTPKAQPYPFWESEDVWGKGPLAGHIMGFYLSSMAMMYEATSDSAIIKKLQYTLSGLNECQKAQGDGYLLAVPNGRRVFEDVAKGRFTTTNPLINDSWEPVYIMNKVMLGLYSVYNKCNLSLAKEILIKMADWFGNSVLDKLSHDHVQKLLYCEHGSINESYVNVYTVTSDKKYLAWAERLNDEVMLIPASQNRDILEGWHANTQIPKFTGFENVYDYTGDRKYTDAARFFWKAVVSHHTWVNGGNSTGEHFFPISEFEHRVTQTGGPESCNSVNMLRLTEALYKDYGEMEKVDYYEKTLFNHILANYNPENGACVYYTSMRPGHYKIYGTLYNSFWCCTGTGFESPAKFGQMIYAHDGKSVYVNLFIPSELNWNERGIAIKQYTRFPDEDKTEFNIVLSKAQGFKLKIRRPYWAKTFSVKINGKNIAFQEEDGYAKIERDWKNGDKVSVDFSSEVTIEPLPGTDKFLSLKYGPIVLAAMIDNQGLKKEDFTKAKETVASKEIPVRKTRTLIGDQNAIAQSIVRVSKDSLTFNVNGNSDVSFQLIPFYRIYFNRYEIYFPHYNSLDEFNKVKLAESNRELQQQRLYEKTTDRVVPGDSASESLHKMEQINSTARVEGNKSLRRGFNNAYFMYQVKVFPSKKQSAYFLFSPLGQKNQAFDIQIDGKRVLSIDSSIAKKNNSKHREVLMPLPSELINDKDYITVRLIAKNSNDLPSLYDLRIVEGDFSLNEDEN